MDRNFWLERWENQQTGFHRADENPQLLAHRQHLPSAPARVFVPLAGKSLDLVWLMKEGHDVVAVELSGLAVRAFFDEHALTPTVQQEGELRAHRVPGLTFYEGDFFALRREQLVGVAGVYDRAATVALPPALRARYVEHMADIVPEAAVTLLISIERADGSDAGPPFSIPEPVLRALYEPTFKVHKLGDSAPDARGFSEPAYKLVRGR